MNNYDTTEAGLQNMPRFSSLRASKGEMDLHEEDDRTHGKMDTYFPVIRLDGFSSLLSALILDDRAANASELEVDEHLHEVAEGQSHSEIHSLAGTSGMSEVLPSLSMVVVHPAAAAHFLRAVSAAVSEAQGGWVSWTKGQGCARSVNGSKAIAGPVAATHLPCPFKSVSSEIHWGAPHQCPWRDALGTPALFRVARFDGTNVAVRMAALVRVGGGPPSLVALGKIVMPTHVLRDSSLGLPSHIKEPTDSADVDVQSNVALAWDGAPLNVALAGGEHADLVGAQTTVQQEDSSALRGAPQAHCGSEPSTSSSRSEAGECSSPPGTLSDTETLVQDMLPDEGEDEAEPRAPVDIAATLPSAQPHTDNVVPEVFLDRGHSGGEVEAEPRAPVDVVAVPSVLDGVSAGHVDVAPAAASTLPVASEQEADAEAVENQMVAGQAATIEEQTEAIVDEPTELRQLTEEIQNSALDPGSEYECLDSLQERLSAIEPTALKCTETRELAATAQERIDELHRQRAKLHRTSCGMEEMYHPFQLSKPGLARSLNIRAYRNAQCVLQSKEEVTAFQVPPDAFQDIDLDQFTCDVSRVRVDEALEEGDVMGFGISLKSRPESVVEDPMQLAVESLSATMLTRQTFDDAVKYGLKSKGSSNTLGGFERTPGVVLLGRGREEINAWLPLAICPTHVSLVKIMLPQIVGFLFTLDPLGYHPMQLPALYSLLAHLLVASRRPLGANPCAADTTPQARGRDAMLVGEFLRMCSTLLRDARKILGYDPVQRFLAGPAQKDRPDPMLVVGWAVAQLGALPRLATCSQGSASTDSCSDAGQSDDALRREAEVAEALRVPLLIDAVQRYSFGKKYTCRKKRIAVGRLLYGALWQPVGGSCRSNDSDSNGADVADEEGTSPPAVDARVDEAFAKYGREVLRRGRQGHEEEEGAAAVPEFEPRKVEEGGGGEKKKDLDEEFWDGEVERTAKELEAQVEASTSMTTLRGAVGLPQLEALGVRRRKALLVAGLRGIRVGECAEEEVLAHAHEWLERVRETEKWDQQFEEEHRARLIAWSGSMEAFCGRLMAGCPQRGNGVWRAVVRIFKRKSAASIPLCDEKLRVLVLGRCAFKDESVLNVEGEAVEHPVLGNGNVWGLNPKEVASFSRVIGAEAMNSLYATSLDRLPRRQKPRDRGSKFPAHVESSPASD